MVDEKHLEYFSKLIKEKIGIVYIKENYYQLSSRLEDICKQLKIESVDEFYRQYKQAEIQGDRSLESMLLDTATNNETKFFRDIGVFNAIKNILEEYLKAGKNYLNIWSAACSTGQEPYSLAMILYDLEKKGYNFKYYMLATDYSDRVLKHASEGVYTQLQVQRGLSAPMLLTHFDQDSDGKFPNWRIKPYLKKSLIFKQMNLIEPWGHVGSFDLILCRNVLIYQNSQNKRSIVSRFCDHLIDDGYLVLGGTESMIGLSDQFEVKKFGGSVIHQKITGKKAS